MVDAVVRFPDGFDRAVLGPVAFVQQRVNGEPVTDAERFEALETCAALRSRHPREPSVFHLSGLICYINDNDEAAIRFWGAALVIDPNYLLPEAPLAELIAADAFWPDVKTYLACLAEGEDAVPDLYLGRARASFADGDFEAADRFGQRASAYRRSEISQLSDCGVSRRATEALRAAGELEARYRQIAGKFQTYWAALGEDAILAGLTEWRDLADRRQLAEIVAELAAAAAARGDGPIHVFEIGCFGGYNLNRIAETLDAADRGRVVLTGIEPNATAVAFAGENFPGISVALGGHEEMISGVVPAPERIDICVISRVFMILHPDEVQRILAYFAGRAERLVICEDIYNTEGDMAIIRMPSNFLIMHPFRKFLAAAGFTIERLAMAEVPDRECTGFIVAAAANGAG